MNAHIIDRLEDTLDNLLRQHLTHPDVMNAWVTEVFNAEETESDVWDVAFGVACKHYFDDVDDLADVVYDVFVHTGGAVDCHWHSALGIVHCSIRGAKL